VTPRPPRIAEWLAGRLLPVESRDATLGDLHERYVDRVRRSGTNAARWWYVRQTLGFVALMPAARIGWGADLRDAARGVVRQPALSASVVAVLALAIGAATAVFSVVDGVLLRPLPFAAPDDLVMLWDEYPKQDGGEPMPVTRRHYEAWRDRSDLLASAGAFESMPAVVDAGRWPDRIDAALVSASLLTTLGVQPALGRLFAAEDDVAGAPPVVILSDEFWRARFGGDPSVIGREMRIDGVDTRIVGVMPRDFWFYDPYAVTRSYRSASASAARLWRPLAGRFPDESEYPRYRVIARLQSGVTAEVAAAGLAATERALPASIASADGRVRVMPLDRQIAAPVRSRLIALSLAVALVLIVGGVNLVSLMVSRLEARRSELAVRAALGAGRGRIARLLMLQGALLALAGGAAGLAVTWLALPQLLGLVPRGLPLAHRVGIGPVVVLFAVGVSLAVGLLVSGFAVARLGPSRLSAAIASRSRLSAGSATGRRFAGALVAVEVALSVTLVIGAVLLLRGFVDVAGRDAGFEPRQTLAFQSLLVMSPAGEPPNFGFFDRLEARLKDVPGVAAAGSATILPFSRWARTTQVRVADGGEPGDTVTMDERLVSPGYFEALDMRLLAGRAITSADTGASTSVVVANEAAMRRLSAAATGSPATRLVVGRTRTVEREIVGVVRNVKEDKLSAQDRPILYIPLAQSGVPMPMRQFVLRTEPGRTIDPESIRQIAAEIDARQPLQEFIGVDALVGQTLEEERFYAVVSAVFAGLATVVALAGLYGVVSFGVRQRDREMGVRMALGADRAMVYRLVLRDGMRPVLIGLAIGGAAAALASRALGSLLHDIAPVDPASYAIAMVAFAAVSALACLVPARRAASIDPVRTLGQS
jgi:predicted permease